MELSWLWPSFLSLLGFSGKDIVIFSAVGVHISAIGICAGDRAGRKPCKLFRSPNDIAVAEDAEYDGVENAVANDEAECWSSTRLRKECRKTISYSG